MNVNILIAFLNTIRLSAHILIVSADALIVDVHRNKRRRKREYIQLRESDEFKTELTMCIEGSLYIDARLLWQQTIGSNST